MAVPHPVWVLLAAGPWSPGVPQLLDRAEAEARAGAPLDLMLTGDGLGWAREPRLSRLAALPGVRIGLCSRSARRRGDVPEAMPPWMRWSSLVAWFRNQEPDHRLWGALP